MCTTTTTNATISSKALLNVIQNNKNNKGGIFTLKSQKTGKDYTYKIKRSEYRNVWFNHIYVEQGYLRFNHIGIYKNGRIYKKGKLVETPSAIAIAFVLLKVEKHAFDWLDAHVELMHDGKCILCGRTLTDAESIKRGLGPVCAG